MRIVLAGGEAAGARALQRLTSTDLTVIAVAAPARSRLADRARADRIQVLDPASVANPDFARWITDRRIDVLVNVHSLHLVAAEALAALRIGGFNLHPGPLPNYAGLNAPSWSIINGAARHAVTLHRMDAGIDTGPIVAEASFDLDDRATGLSVSTHCVRLGLDLLDAFFSLLAAGNDISMTPAEGERRLYRGSERPFEGRVPWTRSADVIDRLVRGCAYHPMHSPIGTPTTATGGRRFGLLAGFADVDSLHADDGLSAGRSVSPGQVVAVVDTRAHVATGRGRYCIDRVIADGEVRPAADLLAPGDHLT